MSEPPLPPTDPRSTYWRNALRGAWRNMISIVKSEGVVEDGCVPDDALVNQTILFSDAGIIKTVAGDTLALASAGIQTRRTVAVWFDDSASEKEYTTTATSFTKVWNARIKCLATDVTLECNVLLWDDTVQKSYFQLYCNTATDEEETPASSAAWVEKTLTIDISAMSGLLDLAVLLKSSDAGFTAKAKGATFDIVSVA